MFPQDPLRRIPVSAARERLSAIVGSVQAPEAACVLTRHGKPVAAVVSIATHKRIRRDADFERFAKPSDRPYPSIKGRDGTPAQTERQAAEFVREAQLTRWGERRILARNGMEPLEGGELRVEVEEPVAAPEPEVPAKRRWWRRSGRA